jgi:beta-galactosidase
VRWAQLLGPANGVRVEGDPTFDLTVRRWTSEDLDSARNTSDLRPRDRVFVFVFVNLDLAQIGLGTALCGPGVLPPYELHATPATWTVRLIPLASGAVKANGTPPRVPRNP